MPDRRVVVTRPAADAEVLARDLTAAGLQPTVLPLIEVGAVDGPQPLDQAWRAMPHYLAAMFVSANAVEHFFSRQPGGIPVFNALSSLSARAWATGPGTVKALLRQGAEVAWMDAPLPAAGRFDSEALWEAVRSRVQPGDRVLIVRGADDSDSVQAHDGRGAGAAAKSRWAITWTMSDRIEQVRGPRVASPATSQTACRSSQRRSVDGFPAL